MVSVSVNPEVLEWARKERGLTQEQAAKLLGIPLVELQQLELGTAEPSLATLDHMASKYQIPFASLLMPDPLPDVSRPRIPDFRTYAGKKPIADHELLTTLDVVNIQIDMPRHPRGRRSRSWSS